MVLPKSIEDREYQKFEEVGGQPHVRVTGSGFSGTFTDTGLSIAGLLTVVTVNQLGWTKVPLSAQPDRNTLSICNLSGELVYYNFTNADVDVAPYIGWPIFDQGIENIKITDSIDIYVKSSASSVKILVRELS